VAFDLYGVLSRLTGIESCPKRLAVPLAAFVLMDVQLHVLSAPATKAYLIGTKYHSGFFGKRWRANFGHVAYKLSAQPIFFVMRRFVICLYMFDVSNPVGNLFSCHVRLLLRFALYSLCNPLGLCRLAFRVRECVRLVFVDNLVKSGHCAGGEVVPLRPLQPPN
jgi:hypothetical protein